MLRRKRLSSDRLVQTAVPTAARSVIEALEDRRMLTLLEGGIFNAPGNGYNGGSFFEFQQVGGTTVRIQAIGDITAEFVGLTVHDEDSFRGPNSTTLSDLYPATVPGMMGAELSDSEQYLYAVYIYDAAPDARLIITAYDDPTGTGVKVAQPFGGPATIVADPASGNDPDPRTVSLPGGTGAVLIGGTTLDEEGVDFSGDRPILAVTRSPLTGLLTTVTGDFDGDPMTPDTTGTTEFQLPFGPLGNSLFVPGIYGFNNVNLDRLLVGGTITGVVEWNGSIETFYAGNILTGDADGLFGSTTRPEVFNEKPGSPNPDFDQTDPLSQPSLRDNFRSLSDNFVITGNLHNLLVKGSVGTDAVLDDVLTPSLYRTGFDLVVEGRLGQFKMGEDFSGIVEVLDNAGGAEFFVQREQEILIPSGVMNFVEDQFLRGNVVDPFIDNDTFDNPQIINGATDPSGVVQIAGSLLNTRNEDLVDYYAMPMIAGQTVNLIINEFFPIVTLGFFDPDGRLVQTNFSGAGNLIDNFAFTATRPGTYRLAVAGDPAFATADRDVTRIIYDGNYSINIFGDAVSDMSIGGFWAEDALLDDAFYGLLARNGDLGIAHADGRLAGFDNTALILAENGDLRSVEAGELGFATITETENILGGDVEVLTFNGDVGSVRTSAADGTMYLNGLVASDGELESNKFAVDGDIQLIDAAGDFYGNIVTNGGLGVFRAGSYSVDLTGSAEQSIIVDADREGGDGVIDLIDVTGDVGTSLSGGPSITVGPQGNIKYMRVGGTAFRDVFFGGGVPEETTFDAGQRVILTDDSGTDFEVRPESRLATTADAVGTLTVLTYPIRSGGSVVLNITSTTGVRVASTSGRSGGSIDIGNIDALGEGTPIVETTAGGTSRLQLDTSSTSTDLGVRLEGSQPINVLSITGGEFNEIVNNTGGEIVTVDATSIGTLRGTRVGQSVSRTGAAVEPQALLLGSAATLDDYPFDQESTAIMVSGDVLRIETEALGDVQIDGRVVNVTTNLDNRSSRGIWEGIDGVFVAGTIDFIDIGEGILPTDAGDAAGRGIFATTRLDRLVGRNEGADIRGSVATLGSIGTIELNGGSIISTRILSVTELVMASPLPQAIATPSSTGSISSPIYTIERVNLTGNGGIIGTLFEAADVGPISTTGGFGMINSRIIVPGPGVIAGVTADGLGIRGSLIEGGSRVLELRAIGDGSDLDLSTISSTVQDSRNERLNPYSNKLLDASDDLLIALSLGYGETANTFAGVTDTGVMENNTVTSSREIDVVAADEIRTRELDPLLVLIGQPSSEARLSAGVSIDSITAADGINGLDVTGGALGILTSGGDMRATDVTISGSIGTVAAGGILAGNSNINALGPDGTIGTVSAGRSNNADISASVSINAIRAGTFLGGIVRSFGDITLISVGTVSSSANVRADDTLTRITADTVDSGALVEADDIGTISVGTNNGTIREF